MNVMINEYSIDLQLAQSCARCVLAQYEGVMGRALLDKSLHSDVQG
jgi:hypothetical protein